MTDEGIEITRKAAVEHAANGKCDCVCDPCIGQVKVCRVVNEKQDADWGYFAYCDAAIEEDVSRGMKVEVIS